MHIYLSILYTHIHAYINLCFINTVLQSGVCQNLSRASLFKQRVTKFQSCTDGWLPTSLFLQSVKQCFCFIPAVNKLCSKRWILKASLPRSSSTLLSGAYTPFGEHRRKEVGTERAAEAQLSIIKKRLLSLNLRASSGDKTIALQVNNRYAFSKLVLVPFFGG